MNTEPVVAEEDRLVATGWQVIAASVRGAGHIKTGLPCQDANGWLQISPETAVIAVADGAGSAALSEVGASVAVSTALESVRVSEESRIAACGSDGQKSSVWITWLKEAANSARIAVEAEAAARELLPTDLASTLIIAIASRQQIAAIQIGDGAVIAQTAVGLLAVTTPSHGEYLNETTFLTSANAIESAQVATWGFTGSTDGDLKPACTGVTVISDGLQEIALSAPAYEAHAPFFTPLLRFAATCEDPQQASEELALFLQSPRITERTDDDITLVIAIIP